MLNHIHWFSNNFRSVTHDNEIPDYMRLVKWPRDRIILTFNSEFELSCRVAEFFRFLILKISILCPIIVPLGYKNLQSCMRSYSYISVYHFYLLVFLNAFTRNLCLALFWQFCNVGLNFCDAEEAQHFRHCINERISFFKKMRQSKTFFHS